MNNIQEFYNALKNYQGLWERLNKELLKTKMSSVVRNIISNAMCQILTERETYIRNFVEWNCGNFFTSYKGYYIMLLDYAKDFVLFGVDVQDKRICCKITEEDYYIFEE